MMSVLPLASARLKMEICVKKFYYFLSFLWFFNHEFIMYIDFACIAASNTAMDAVKN